MHTAKLTELLQDALAKLRKGVLARQEGEGGGRWHQQEQKERQKGRRRGKAESKSQGSQWWRHVLHEGVCPHVNAIVAAQLLDNCIHHDNIEH